MLTRLPTETGAAPVPWSGDGRCCDVSDRVAGGPSPMQGSPVDSGDRSDPSMFGDELLQQACRTLGAGQGPNLVADQLGAGPVRWLAEHRAGGIANGFRQQQFA